MRYRGFMGGGGGGWGPRESEGEKKRGNGKRWGGGMFFWRAMMYVISYSPLLNH